MVHYLRRAKLPSVPARPIGVTELLLDSLIFLKKQIALYKYTHTVIFENYMCMYICYICEGIHLALCIIFLSLYFIMFKFISFKSHLTFNSLLVSGV